MAAFAWAMIFQFLQGQTAAYGAFAFVIIEGAVRFGLIASLIMEVIFVAGLTAAMLYRVSEYGSEFSWTGYAFWAIFLFFIALSVGLVTEEARAGTPPQRQPGAGAHPAGGAGPDRPRSA